MESIYEHAGGHESLRRFIDILREVPRWEWPGG
jgi:hypothetical protein